MILVCLLYGGKGFGVLVVVILSNITLLLMNDMVIMSGRQIRGGEI